MSHFTKILSQYRDVQALRIALQRCNVPDTAMVVTEEGKLMVNYYGKQEQMAHVIVASEKGQETHGTKDCVRGLSADMGFRVEKNPELASEFICDPMRWPSTLLGCDGKATQESWLKKVRKEYDFATQEQRARNLGKRFARIEQEGRLFCVIGA
jgi:hypothetical protein